MKVLVKYISFLLTVASAVSLGSCTAKTTRIYGNITGLPDGYVYISSYDETLSIVDSIRSRDGLFEFSLRDALPDLYFVSFESYAGHYIPVLVEPGEIFVNGNFNYHDDIKVGGTPSNDILWQFREQVRDYEIMLKAVELQLNDLTDIELSAADSLSFRHLEHKRDSINDVIHNMRQEFVRENPNTIVAAMFTVMALSRNDLTPGTGVLLENLDLRADNAFIRRLNARISAS